MTTEIIDMRSDTVTKPTKAMWEAISNAAVGDDVYGEDDTVNKLQVKGAEMFGKESALYVPSGTMGNLIAILTHARPGEEIILGDLSHMYLNEQGGCASLAGVVPKVLRNQPDGTIPLELIKNSIKGTDVHHAQTRVVALENTHNFCGGTILSPEYVDSVANFLKEYGKQTNNIIKLHLDGARVFNAAVGQGKSVKEITHQFDSISVCLSKGLGAPVGSLLLGTKDFIDRARRWRKALGGGMRQAGVIAAAGIVALDDSEKLKIDHSNAKLIAEQIQDDLINVYKVDTNIVIAEFKEDSPTINAIKLKELTKNDNLLISSISNKIFRVTTHHHITEEHAKKAAKIIKDKLQELKA